MREVAVPAHEVEAVADHELGWDLEPDVLDVDVDPLQALLVEQGADHDDAEGVAAGIRFQPYENVIIKFDATYGKFRPPGAEDDEDFSMLALAGLYRF